MTSAPSLRVLFVLSVLATMALGVPFVLRDEIVWQQLQWQMLAGTMSLAAALFLHAFATTTLRDACLFFICAFVVGAAAEASGLRWRFPFFATYIPFAWCACSAKLLPLIGAGSDRHGFTADELVSQN